MDTRFLESLIAVVESGSIAGAARAQNLTAAAVSQRIRVLETELGSRLLVRTSHAAQPTPECLRVLPAARELVKAAQRLSSATDAQGLGGPYRLGAVSTVLVDYGPTIIDTFKENAPKATLTIRPGTSRVLYQDLVAGHLDAVLISEPPFSLPKSLHSRLFCEEKAVHILPAGVVKKDVGDAVLPWIVYDREAWGGRVIWNACERIIRSGHILCELDGLETIAQMVARGAGQAIVPDWRGLNAQRSNLQELSMTTTAVRKLVLVHPTASVVASLTELVLAAISKAP
ncbi:LysR family transcriptional regulator [Roseibium porphyridii]|uniref:LysR family transcriptional regulator n=1 Tax=Roseibium porphyridii TaxID=2866279 RepID=A0ABY8F5R4_9HYPH|nr:LysR family transcriptional regulator [Roseibium sp. KMA01]WFE90833.1 LysR family transcriptional regulator [Roseibium sp. KMA01]